MAVAAHLGIVEGKKIWERTGPSMGWRGDNDAYRNSEYLGILQNVILQEPLWFVDDAEPFARRVEAAAKTNTATSDWSFAGHVLASVFREMLPKTPSRMLVPPKRSIELAHAINTGQGVASNGSGS